MCASTAARGILLIQTSRETYGITPEREDEFLSALEDRLPPETTAVGSVDRPRPPAGDDGGQTTAFELRELAPEHGLEP
jgi:hypothetical protein